MSGFQSFWNGLDWSVLTDMLLSVIPALLCITLHELSHGYAAWRLGDDTAKNAGRLTLNPLRHIDPMGLVMMVAFHFGWAKPVPVDMRNFRSPKRDMAVTAAAGPLCNLLITVVLLFLYGLLWLPLKGENVALDLLLITARLSLSLAVFNVLPIPPLDGSKVLYAFLPEDRYYTLMRYERYGMILLLVAVATGILGSPLSSVTGWLFEKLSVLVQWGWRLSVLAAG
ncbi:MAG: site-2 protease family protein [Oscillospiraceae bacterium]|nr:site-2 protease family protein [Oscillospiraceae bacterium]